MGVDVSEGRIIESKDERPKEDWSVFTVVDDKGVVCAMYRSRKKVEAVWHDLLMLARLYNNAFVQVERNSVGSGLISMMILTNYPNMRAENGPKAWRDRVGVYLAGSVKRQTMLEHLRIVYEMSPNRAFCYINDEETFQDQAETFINIDGKPQSDSGCHDDIILSCAHAEDCRRHYLGDSKCKELVSDQESAAITEIRAGSVADILGDAARGMWRF
jgi:hypothetical protein